MTSPQKKSGVQFHHTTHDHNTTYIIILCTGFILKGTSLMLINVSSEVNGAFVIHVIVHKSLMQNRKRLTICILALMWTSTYCSHYQITECPFKNIFLESSLQRWTLMSIRMILNRDAKWTQIANFSLLSSFWFHF